VEIGTAKERREGRKKGKYANEERMEQTMTMEPTKLPNQWVTVVLSTEYSNVSICLVVKLTKREFPPFLLHIHVVELNNLQPNGNYMYHLF
jgi:hypothetical protein